MRLNTGANIGSIAGKAPTVPTKRKAGFLDQANTAVVKFAKKKSVTSPVTGRTYAEPTNDDGWLEIERQDKEYEAQQKQTGVVNTAFGGAKIGGDLQARGPTWNMNSSPDQIIAQSQGDKQAFLDQAAAANPLLNKITDLAKFMAPFPGLIPKATDIIAGPAALVPRNENLTGMMAKPMTPVATDPGRIVPGDVLASGRILTHPDSTPLQRLLSGGELFVDAGAPGAGKALGAVGRTPAVKGLFEALGILPKEIKAPPIVGTDAFEQAMAAKSAATAPVDPIAQELGKQAKKAAPVQTAPSLQVKTGGATVRTKPKSTVPVTDVPPFETSTGARSWLTKETRAKINSAPASELKKMEAELTGKAKLNNQEQEALTLLRSRLRSQAKPFEGATPPTKDPNKLVSGVPNSISNSAEVVINGKLVKLEGAELEAYRQTLKPKLSVVEGTGPKPEAKTPVAVNTPVQRAPNAPISMSDRRIADTIKANPVAEVATGRKRQHMLGGQEGARAEMQFASAEQERLYDLGAAQKSTMRNRGRTQDSTVINKQNERLKNATPEDLAKATEVYNDVRAQMKGVKDGETRVLREYTPAKATEPVKTPVVKATEPVSPKPEVAPAKEVRPYYEPKAGEAASMSADEWIKTASAKYNPQSKKWEIAWGKKGGDESATITWMDASASPEAVLRDWHSQEAEFLASRRAESAKRAAAKLSPKPEVATPSPVKEAVKPSMTTPDKDPWLMTRDEYAEWRTKFVSGPSGKKTRSLAKKLHKDMVRIWLKEGKPVAPEALSGYPDLATPSTPPVKVEAPKVKKGGSVAPPKLQADRIPTRGSMGPRYRFGSGRSRAGTNIFDPAEYAEIIRRAKTSGVKTKAEFMEYVKRFDKSGDMTGWSEAFDKSWATAGKAGVRGAKGGEKEEGPKTRGEKVREFGESVESGLTGLSTGTDITMRGLDTAGGMVRVGASAVESLVRAPVSLALAKRNPLLRQEVWTTGKIRRALAGTKGLLKKEAADVLSGLDATQMDKMGGIKTDSKLGKLLNLGGLSDVPARHVQYHMALDDFAGNIARRDGGDRVAILNMLREGKAPGKVTQKELDDILEAATQTSLDGTYNNKNFASRAIRAAEDMIEKQAEKRGAAGLGSATKAGLRAFMRYSKVLTNVGLDTLNRGPAGVLEGGSMLIGTKKATKPLITGRRGADVMAKGVLGTGTGIAAYMAGDPSWLGMKIIQGENNQMYVEIPPAVEQLTQPLGGLVIGLKARIIQDAYKAGKITEIQSVALMRKEVYSLQANVFASNVLNMAGMTQLAPGTETRAGTTVGRYVPGIIKRGSIIFDSATKEGKVGEEALFGQGRKVQTENMLQRTQKVTPAKVLLPTKTPKVRYPN